MVCVPLCLKKMRTGSVAVAEKQQIRDSEKRGQECANEHLALQVAIVLQKQVQHIEGYYDSAHACVPVQCKWLQPLCSATAWKPGRKGRFDMLVNMQACMHDSFEAWVLLYDLAVRWVWKNVLMTMCMHYALCQVESCLKAGSGGFVIKNILREGLAADSCDQDNNDDDTPGPCHMGKAVLVLHVWIRTLWP